MADTIEAPAPLKTGPVDWAIKGELFLMKATGMAKI